jgi:hypothetical protein
VSIAWIVPVVPDSGPTNYLMPGRLAKAAAQDTRRPAIADAIISLLVGPSNRLGRAYSSCLSPERSGPHASADFKFVAFTPGRAGSTRPAKVARESVVRLCRTKLGRLLLVCGLTERPFCPPTAPDLPAVVSGSRFLSKY